MFKKMILVMPFLLFVACSKSADEIAQKLNNNVPEAPQTETVDQTKYELASENLPLTELPQDSIIEFKEDFLIYNGDNYDAPKDSVVIQNGSQLSDEDLFSVDWQSKTYCTLVTTEEVKQSFSQGLIVKINSPTVQTDKDTLVSFVEASLIENTYTALRVSKNTVGDVVQGCFAGKVSIYQPK